MLLRPLLWLKLYYYSHNKKKDTCWREMSMQLCRKKWRSSRGTYYKKVNQASRRGKSLGEIVVKRTLQEKDGRLKNLLKTSYLRRWNGRQDSDGNDADTHRDSEANFADRRPTNNMDFARMKIENTTLKESLESMEHLICAVRRLRLSLFKFKEPAASKGMENCSSESLDNIINEASQLKTALGISLPLSWDHSANVLKRR